MYIEKALPSSIGSMPRSLHWSIILAMEAMSALSQLAPSAQAGSYSTLSMRSPA